MVDLLSTPSSQLSPVLLRSTPDFGLALQVSAYERGNEADTEITPRVSETRILPAQLAMITAEPVDLQALCSKLGHRTRSVDKLRRTASTAGVAWTPHSARGATSPNERKIRIVGRFAPFADAYNCVPSRSPSPDYELVGGFKFDETCDADDEREASIEAEAAKRGRGRKAKRVSLSSVDASMCGF